MKNLIYEVEAPLNEVIRHFFYMQTPPGSEPQVFNLLPNFEVMLIFNFGTPISATFNNDQLERHTLHRTLLISPLRKTLNYELQAGADAIVMVCSLNGFYRLFNIPIDEISRRDLWDPEVLLHESSMTTIYEKLCLLSGAEERIAAMNACFTALINANNPAFEGLMDNISYFNDTAIQPGKAIAQDIKVSERTVQQRFQKYLGYSPKEMLRYLRFKKMVDHVLSVGDQNIDLFELIEMHGYYDQSHLTKDFKYFMGTTPGKFLKDIAGKSFCQTKPGKFY